MMTFKPDEIVQVTNDWAKLNAYAISVLAGQRVKIVCKNFSGYNVEYTNAFGDTNQYFIKSEDLMPIYKAESPNEPRWKQVSREWQNKLWDRFRKD